MSRNWRDIEDYDERHAARRQQDPRPHVIYRFESPDRKVCYIGVTANYDERIRSHCEDKNRSLYLYLEKYTLEQAKEFFKPIDTEARGFAKAETRESELIKVAFFDAFVDIEKPWPLNLRTHDMDVDEFRKIIEKVKRERDLPREHLERLLREEAEERNRLEGQLLIITKERKRLEHQLRTQTEERRQPERQLREQIEWQKQLERELQAKIEQHRRLERQLHEGIEQQKQLERELLAEIEGQKQRKRRIGCLAGTLFTILLVVVIWIWPPPSPPPDTPTSTLTPSPTPPLGMPYTVLYNGSVVRACASRECDRLGTLSAGARILVNRRDEGECISGNCIWLEFEFASQEAFLHSSLAEREPSAHTPTPAVENLARVLWVVDGDTIQVNIGGKRYSVRYIGVDSPEHGDICYTRAKEANARLVAGRTVALVRDVSDTDRYGRLLRYVYIGDTFVNEALVRDGFAENSVWEPDTRFANRFRALERQARAANRGCHRSGAFDDGDPNR